MLHRTPSSIALLIAGLGAAGMLWYFVPAPANLVLVGITVLSVVLASSSLMHGNPRHAVLRLTPGLYSVFLVPIYPWSIDPLFALPAGAEPVGWGVYLAIALVVLPICGVVNSVTLTDEQVRGFGRAMFVALALLVGVVVAAGMLRSRWFPLVRQVIGILVLIGLGGLIGAILYRWRAFLDIFDDRGLPTLVPERGQALMETAIFSVVLAIIAYGLLSWVPVHRARSVANTAAYSCAQFISQSSNPARAQWMGETAAWETLNGDWSGSLGVSYSIEVAPPAGPGEAGVCVVSYRTPAWFGGLLGTESRESATWYASRGERWKARWR